MMGEMPDVQCIKDGSVCIEIFQRKLLVEMPEVQWVNRCGCMRDGSVCVKTARLGKA
jgi:hypothetical protein